MIRPAQAGIIVWMSSAVFAQVPAQPAFEAATVKAAAPITGGGRASTSGDRVVYANTTISNALARAFQVKFANQIVGPSWISTERYDIVAKAADNTPKEQIPLLLQTLLIDRFHLVLHHESRELPAYALITGKGSTKLVEDASHQKDSMVINNGRREARSMSMANLAQLASFTPCASPSSIARAYRDITISRTRFRRKKLPKTLHPRSLLSWRIWASSWSYGKRPLM